jgi:hypothetical protein
MRVTFVNHVVGFIAAGGALFEGKHTVHVRPEFVTDRQQTVGDLMPEL